MRSRTEHLDYAPLVCADFGWQRRPACNYDALGWIALAASLTASAISYDAGQTQAKQAEYNAEAQSKALNQEATRQRLEEDENRRRALVEQRRFRAQQLAAMASTGVQLGTGTALEIEADTWQKQQIELADRQRVADLSQRELLYQSGSVLDMGRQQASQFRRDATGQALSGLASAAGTGYGNYSQRPRKATYP